MVPRRRQHVQTGDSGGLAAVLYGQFRAKPPKVGGLATCDRQHPAEEEQGTGLHDLYIGAERSGNRGKLNVVVMQPLFCASLPGVMRDRGVHRILLWMVLSQNPARSQQAQEKSCGDEQVGCFLVAMRVNTPVCPLPFAEVRAAIDV